MITNFDLEKLARFYKLPLVSVCMKNELPPEPKEGCYIVNMQSSSAGSGTHWVAFFFFKNICYYFDSFGASPPLEIINFIKKKKGSHLLFNNFIIQNIKSSNCGYFALAFLLYMYANRQKSNLKEVFNEFVNNFADDTTKNDDILKSFFASSPLSSSPSILKKFIKD
jgi:hypothetical protein